VKSAMVSRGSTGGAENRPGTGAAMPCPAPGKRFRDRGTSQGRLEQQLPTDPCVLPAPPGQGKRRVGLACSGGDAWGSLQTAGFHLISSLSVVALKLLEKDNNPSVHSFASQTIHILRSAREQPTWRRTL